jgi:hypothetical protein
MRIARLTLLVVAVSGISAGTGALYRIYQAAVAVTPGDYPDPTHNVVAPPGVRIKVEVLNASTVRGLARRAATYLRDREFDVVHIGTATEQSDTTIVLDRSGHPEWAQLIANAMEGTAVSSPDSSRYLDATVLVGASWRPPSRPFYP